MDMHFTFILLKCAGFVQTHVYHVHALIKRKKTLLCHTIPCGCHIFSTWKGEILERCLLRKCKARKKTDEAFILKATVVPVCDVGCFIIIDRSVPKDSDFSSTLKLLDMTCYHVTYRITGALYHGILVLRKHSQFVCKENCWLKFDTLFQKFEAFEWTGEHGS